VPYTVTALRTQSLDQVLKPSLNTIFLIFILFLSIYITIFEMETSNLIAVRTETEDGAYEEKEVVS
jgi:hypothetical protein